MERNSREKKEHTSTRRPLEVSAFDKSVDTFIANASTAVIVFGQLNSLNEAFPNSIAWLSSNFLPLITKYAIIPTAIMTTTMTSIVALETPLQRKINDQLFSVITHGQHTLHK